MQHFPISNVNNSQNAGQNCIGIERLIVHESQHDELFEILAERREKMRCGSVMAPAEGGYVPTVDCGAMINADRFTALSAAVKLAQEQGAQVEGGNPWNHSYLEHGTFFEPTLVGSVTPDMVIAQHESKFGSPILL
jgi:acyl-CoA reductase-like NAD-dependent aldehyde dehydrogenase